MAFDEKAYEAFLPPYSRRNSIPEDRLERYAITLPATDAEIAAQLKAVRAYWNKKMVGQTRLARTAKSCKTEDDELAKDPGSATAAWWAARQRERDHAARQQIDDLAGLLTADHAALGVVTAAAVERAAASMGLTMAQAEQAARQAGLAVIPANVTLPDAPPLPAPVFGQLSR